MSRRVTDPRWDGVELPSLYKVVCRETPDDTPRRLKVYEKATRAIRRTGKWKEWEAVKRADGQIIGYRRLRAGDWFIRRTDGTGEVRGPFKTKRLCLANVREQKGTKVSPGVYTAGDYTLFTRESGEGGE